VPSKWSSINRTFPAQCIIRTAASLVRRMGAHSKAIWFSDVYFVPSTVTVSETIVGDLGYDYDAAAATYFPSGAPSSEPTYTYFDDDPYYDVDRPYGNLTVLSHKFREGPPVLAVTAATVWLTRTDFDGCSGDVVQGIQAIDAQIYARGVPVMSIHAVLMKVNLDAPPSAACNQHLES
jgi:hypothetical protein